MSGAVHDRLDRAEFPFRRIFEKNRSDVGEVIVVADFLCLFTIQYRVLRIKRTRNPGGFGELAVEAIRG